MPEKVHLIDKYNSTTFEFSCIVGMLQAKRGVMAKEEYERIQRFKKARSRSEQARLTLEQHVAEHGC